MLLEVTSSSDSSVMLSFSKPSGDGLAASFSPVSNDYCKSKLAILKCSNCDFQEFYLPLLACSLYPTKSCSKIKTQRFFQLLTNTLLNSKWFLIAAWIPFFFGVIFGFITASVHKAAGFQNLLFFFFPLYYNKLYTRVLDYFLLVPHEIIK